MDIFERGVCRTCGNAIIHFGRLYPHPLDDEGRRRQCMPGGSAYRRQHAGLI